MSCCDNRYAPLRASGELNDNHLAALRQLAQTTKPVFRRTCPPGYSHCARSFDPTKPEMVTNDKLWFIDGHGHLCMPNCGWGSSVDLRLKDKAAQLVRQGKIGGTTATPEKIQSVASGMMCDPCGPSSASVSKAANALACTIRELERTDKEIDDKGQADVNKYLTGGGARGGCWSSSMAGGGMPAQPEPSIVGGAKLSKDTKCTITSKVAGLNVTQEASLRTRSEELINKYKNKRQQYYTDKLRCKLSKLSEDPQIAALVTNNSVLDLPLAVETALLAVNVADAEEAKKYGLVLTSCYSNTYKIDDTNVKQIIQQFKAAKQLFDALMNVFSCYRRGAKQCDPVTAEEKEMFHRQLNCAFDKFEQATGKHGFNDKVPAVVRKDPSGETNIKFLDIAVLKTNMWAQVEGCATLTCEKALDETECTKVGGVRVCTGSSMVCLPTNMNMLKTALKFDKKFIQAVLIIHEYQKEILAQERRLIGV